MTSTHVEPRGTSGPEDRTQPSSEPPTPGRSLWHNRDFLKLWSGETVAAFGAQVTQLALPLLVLGLGASATQVGVVSAMQYLPALCVTPFAGLLIDMFDRRLILLVANLVRATALAMVPVLHLVEALSVPALCVIAFLVGSGTAVFDVAYLAYLPALVPRRHLVDANSKLQGSYSVAQIGGPGVGGLLIRALGAWFAILANVVAYLAAFVIMFLIRHREPPRTPADETARPRLADILTSFGLLWRHRILRVLTFQAGWFNLCEQAILTLFLVYSVKELGMDAGGVGFVLALGSVASLAGAVVAKRAGNRFGFPRVLILAMGFASVAPTLLLPTGGSTPWNFVSATLTFAVYGFGLTIYNVHVVAFRQSVIPSEVLGRATAAYRMLTYGPFPLGAFLGGLMGERFGLWNSILVFAIASVAGWSLFASACWRLPAAAAEKTPTA
ncbi:MFS family permease [Streptomyces luteogriseus]|uniref:MFS transporter n=1 Tax=Streptomyces luteogriseus TaxID=68233 RepID=UPI0027833355|nr:MFS transporter [Streptomyces luteogriseus]MDQ0714020.1 MFS family permease [Streptomyces luteogriseus]